MMLAGKTNVMAGPFQAQDLTATSDDLKFIGMPINGICTGQVYLGGDGKLWHWNLTANKDKKNTPKGFRYLKPDPAKSPIDQGFAIKVADKVHTLDAKGFKDIRFTNQYPMGQVDYADDGCPIGVQLQAYTPFIPLNRDDSSYPVIVMRYTLTNNGSNPQDVSIAGWIENISNRELSKKPKLAKIKGEKLTVSKQSQLSQTIARLR